MVANRRYQGRVGERRLKDDDNIASLLIETNRSLCGRLRVHEQGRLTMNLWRNRSQSVEGVFGDRLGISHVKRRAGYCCEADSRRKERRTSAGLLLQNR